MNLHLHKFTADTRATLLLGIVLASVAVVPEKVRAQEYDQPARDEYQHVDDTVDALEPHAEDERAIHAEGGEHHGGIGALVGNVEFIGAVVNFVLLLAIFYFLFRKPLAGFLVNRRRSIEEALAEAQRLKEAAEAKYKEYAERIEHLDQEIARIRTEMVRAGEAERDRIVAEAESKAARMRRESEFLIEQQLKQLRIDLTRELVSQAIDAARTTLNEKLTPADQQRLAQQYIAKLGSFASEKPAQTKERERAMPEDRP